MSAEWPATSIQFSRKKPRVKARLFLVLCLIGLALGNGENSGYIADSGSENSWGVRVHNDDSYRDGVRSSTDNGLSDGGVVDVPTPTPVPPQGRTPTAATGDSSDREANAGRVVGGVGQADVALGGAVSYSALGEIVAAYDWPINEAFVIVECESNWTPDAISWDGSSYGLFQVNSIHSWRWPSFWDTWYNAVDNTRYAYELWLEQGWEPWSCASY